MKANGTHIKKSETHTHNHDENAKNRLNVFLLFVCAWFHFDFVLFIIACDLLSFLLYLYELSQRTCHWWE